MIMARLSEWVKTPAFVFILALALFIALTQYDCQTQIYKSKRQQQLETAIKQQIMIEDPETRYLAKWFDLNSDGTKEAIVHVMSPELCRETACYNFVFQWDHVNKTYRQIGQNKTAYPPIIVTPVIASGWYTLRFTQNDTQLLEYQFKGKRYQKERAVELDLIHDDTPYGAQLISHASIERGVLLFEPESDSNS